MILPPKKNLRKYPNFSPFTRFTPHKEQNPWRTVGEGTVLSSRSIWVRTLNCFATETKNYAPECWKRDCAVPACGWSSRLAVWWTFAIFSVNFKWENTHQERSLIKTPANGKFGKSSSTQKCRTVGGYVTELHRVDHITRADDLCKWLKPVTPCISKLIYITAPEN